MGRLRVANAARAEDETRAGLVVTCVDDRLGPTVVRRPDRLTVKAYVVDDDGAGRQVVDEQERVVMGPRL